MIIKYWFAADGITWQSIDRGAFKALAQLAVPHAHPTDGTVRNFPGERRYTIDRIGLKGELEIRASKPVRKHLPECHMHCCYCGPTPFLAGRT